MNFPRVHLLAAAAALLLATNATATKNEPSGRDAALLAAPADAAVVRQGRENYAALCQACHGEEQARDTLGESPSNLFDSKWYNGSQPAQIEGNILNGLLEKGMPPWKEALPGEDTTALAAYLLSFQKRNGESPARPGPPAK